MRSNLKGSNKWVLQRGWFQLEKFSGRCHRNAWQGLPEIDRSLIMSLMHRLLLIGALSIPLLGEDAILEHARQVNLEFASHMPNFVADEVIGLYRS
jgi:hypothetical protein